MNAMQYNVILPDDYDMSLIRKRVKDNGSKTDNFKGLLFKAYLISEKVQGAISNSYAPLYVWETSEGMNRFIFEGFYDNIIRDFGWQNIQIGIPLSTPQTTHLTSATYLLEQTITIDERSSLNTLPREVSELHAHLQQEAFATLTVYNPDKWCVSLIGFYTEKPTHHEGALYKILHISTQNDSKSQATTQLTL